VAIQTTPNYTLITINKYNNYQEVANKTTNERQTRGKRLATTKEVKKERKSLVTEISDNQKQIINYWNKTYSKNYKYSLSLEENISYWLKKFSLLEIKTAIANIKNLTSQDFWKNMRPALLFSKKNKLGETDYIETALNAEKVKGNTSDELLKQIGL
jgi:hypothetical protein